MVLAERQSEIMRNGRRSRGPSPNGHNNGTPDTSSDDDNSIKRNGKSKTKQSEYEEKIRVGRDYQAVCPELVPAPERKPELLNDRALLVWSPTKEIPDTKLEEYISVAKEKYGYNGEQALGMLFWHKHDLERAVMDLANFTPFPDEWTVEDKVLFEQAFQFHGKSFHRIRQMLPDKSIASLVKYYYSWKKTRHRQSVMDRQEKAKASKDGSENGSDNGSNEESDSEDKDQAMASSSTSQDTKIAIGSISGTGGSSGAANSGNNNSTNNFGIGASGSGIDANRNLNISSKRLQQLGNNQQQINNLNASLNTSSTNNIPTNSGTNQNSTNNSTSAAATATATNSVINSNSTTGSNGGGCCTGCGVSCNQLNSTTNDRLCNSCYHHWRRTGTKRPTTGPYFGKRYRDRNADRHKRKPPRGMHINHDDIVALASSNNNQDVLLANTEREIVSLLSQVQLNKQHMSALKRKISESSEDLRPIETNNRINSRWTHEELSMAVLGVKKYGKDFQAIADTLGTKTEAHIRTFFVNYRRRYNLDNVLKEYEAERDANNQNEDQEEEQETQQQQQPQQEQEQSNKNDDIEEISNDLTVTTTTVTEKVEQNVADSNKTLQIQKNVVDIIEIDSSGTTNDDSPTIIISESESKPEITITSTTSTKSAVLAPTTTATATETSVCATVTSAIEASETVVSAKNNDVSSTVDLDKSETSAITITPLPQLKQQKNVSKEQNKIIMEIDLDSETSEPSPPKKIATTAAPQVLAKEIIKATTTA